MRDLFKDDDEIGEDYDAISEEQPQLTDGEEQPQQEEGGYDDGTGIMQGGSGDPSITSRDFKYIDRFVTVKGMPSPARNTNEESNFLLGGEFAEQFVINFLSSDDQRKIWRSLCDIMDASEGSGNAKVALSDAKLLASRILMKRSSTENALALNERSAHIEQRTRSSITTKTNQIRPASSGGWLSRLFGH